MATILYIYVIIIRIPKQNNVKKKKIKAKVLIYIQYLSIKRNRI